eukprot:jgi/Mesvir1/20379/Mv12287-RA.1
MECIQVVFGDFADNSLPARKKTCRSQECRIGCCDIDKAHLSSCYAIMPVYELLCIAKPTLQKSQLAEILKRAGKAVLDGGGLLKDIKSCGRSKLAYNFRRPGEIFSEGCITAMTFVAAPRVLDEVRFGLSTDERVLRFVVTKQPRLPHVTPPSALPGAVPTPHKGTLREVLNSAFKQVDYIEDFFASPEQKAQSEALREEQQRLYRLRFEALLREDWPEPRHPVERSAGGEAGAENEQAAPEGEKLNRE